MTAKTSLNLKLVATAAAASLATGLALSFLSPSAPPAVIPAAPDGGFEARVEAIVARHIAAHPDKIVESVNAFVAKQQADAAKNADQQAVAKRDEIGKTENRPVLGNPAGDVTLVYFFDSNCHFCKKIDPVLKAVVAANPDVKLVHREIPVLGKPSEYAAQVGSIVWKRHPDRYAAFHDALLGFEGQLTPEKVVELLAATLGTTDADAVVADAENFDANDDARNAQNVVQENLSLATAAGITGTPFVYVLESDGVVRGAADDAGETLQRMIGEARAKRG